MCIGQKKFHSSRGIKFMNESITIDFSEAKNSPRSKTWINILYFILFYSDNLAMEVSLQVQRPLSLKAVFNHTNGCFNIKPFLGSFPFARTTLVNLLFFFGCWLLGVQCSCFCLILTRKFGFLGVSRLKDSWVFFS